MIWARKSQKVITEIFIQIILILKITNGMLILLLFLNLKLTMTLNLILI